jgi:hypothetical protein
VGRAKVAGVCPIDKESPKILVVTADGSAKFVFAHLEKRQEFHPTLLACTSCSQFVRGDLYLCLKADIDFTSKRLLKEIGGRECILNFQAFIN